MMTTKTLNIYQRINAVMKEADYLKKDATVGSGNYGYMAVSHDAVTATLRQHLVSNGIVITVTQIHHKLDKKEQGAKMRLYHGGYTVRLTNIDDKEDYITIDVHSQVYDNGDKASGKAMSYATKYVLLKTFMIETGESDESRAYDPTETLITGTEILELQELLKQADRKEQDMLDFFNKKGFEINSLDQMTDVIFQQTKALLTNAIEKKNAA